VRVLGGSAGGVVSEHPGSDAGFDAVAADDWKWSANGYGVLEDQRTSVGGGGGAVVELELEGAVRLLVDRVEVLGEVGETIGDMLGQSIKEVCSRR